MCHIFEDIMNKYFYLIRNNTIRDIIEYNLTANIIKSLRLYQKEISIVNKSYIKSIKQLCDPDNKISLEKFTEFYQIIECKLPPGHYFNNIYRPVVYFGGFSPYGQCQNCPLKNKFEHENYLAVPISKLQIYINEFANLCSKLDLIFQYIYPTNENLNSSGSELRNFIILVSTEIESNFREILYNNGFITKKDYTMNQFSKLIQPLKLYEYRLSLSKYPEIKSFSPFSTWNTDEPTKSLTWFADYNKIKHDKYGNFQSASIENCIISLMGLAAILLSQINNIESARSTITSYFNIIDLPKWELNEYYIPSFENLEWKSENFDFTQKYGT
jgi:hypothetical protein